MPQFGGILDALRRRRVVVRREAVVTDGRGEVALVPLGRGESSWGMAAVMSDAINAPDEA